MTGPSVARKNLANDDVWLIVPLYNEGAVIFDVVAAARETFPNIVCINDGSTDDSAARARDAGAVVVTHPINLGQGAALQTGLEYARSRPGAEYFVTFDSDGQHRTEDAAEMVDVLRQGDVDVVLGSRFLDSRTRPGLIKRLVLRAAVVFSNMTTGVRLTDAHNGLRALNLVAAGQIKLRQNRMAHASEFVEQVGRTHLRWVEHPVHIVYSDYSRAKGQSVLNSVNILTELMYR